MELFTTRCPACRAEKLKQHMTYETKQNGQRALYQCQERGRYFSETKQTCLEGLRTPLSRIGEALDTRTEGMGLNAAARVVKIAQKTILNWERRLAQLHHVLLLSALGHQFLQVVIEGDEAYTKVKKKVPPHESQGWTIALMDRASRFLWELDGDKREESLFQQAIETLAKVIEQTDDLSLFTDGERRYGNRLFAICQDAVRTGKQGRPKITLKKGVKARVKKKGGQKHNQGRKRPKYQTPWAEHPDTSPPCEEKTIHANHLEAFFSSLRRKCAAFRRRTNTSAKSKGGLRRILRVYWVIHNFVRKHFTTKEVPAVQ